MQKINKKYLTIFLSTFSFLILLLLILFWWKNSENENEYETGKFQDQSDFSWTNTYSLDKENLKYYTKKTSSGIVLESRRVLLNYLKFQEYKTIKDFYKSLENIKIFLIINKISYTNQDFTDIINGYFYELESNNLCDLHKLSKIDKKYSDYFKLIESNCSIILLK